MTAQEIRNKYIEFFEARGHTRIPRALLVPQNDPTTLFTGSGMQPLVPNLLGEPHPAGNRLVDSQTCLRAQDIDEVGDNRHTTFFEMLGNWSLGDYFKPEQIPWFWEFMTDIVGLDPHKLYVTCFQGDDAHGIPKDSDSADIWARLYAKANIEAKQADMGTEEEGGNRGINPGERIFFYAGKANWWCRGGKIEDMPVGEPGGPDTEMFYEFDFIEHDTKYGAKCHPNCDCGRFMEVGNSVFMEYVRRESGFEKLPKQNVDFGAGLERIAAAQLNSSDMFKISVIWPIVEKLEEISGKRYDSNTQSMRVIADHLRAATFLAVDGVVPSNKEQGYVMRRLVRRAIRFAFELGVEQNFLEQIVPVIANLYHDDFPEVDANRDKVIEVLVKDEKAFRQTLRKGLQQLEKLTTQNKKLWTHGSGEELFERNDLLIPQTIIDENDQWRMTEAIALTGTDMFMLSDTYGFPWSLSAEEAALKNIAVARDFQNSFHLHMEEQRARSQTAAKGTFKGGLGGQTLQHRKYHTATHLMYQALRQTLGDHVIQHGSNITEERLRFDFSHPDKMTPEQIKAVEDIVNAQIDADLKVSFAEYPTAEATGPLGALGAFGDRYGDTVKVYKMIADGASEPFSFEICGGPHVDLTGQLAEDGKHFKILKEESSSAGIRRIKAALI